MTIEEWLAKLERTGWLSEVTPLHARRIRARVVDYASNPEAAFEALASSGHGGESDGDPDDLRELIKAYVRASEGRFRPTGLRVKADWDAGTAEISFVFKGRAFSKKLRLHDDFISDVDDFLNHVLQVARIKQRFLYLPTKDQTAGMVFISPETFRRARRLRLIPKQEDWEVDA